jgi:hypothetical protein
MDQIIGPLKLSAGNSLEKSEDLFALQYPVAASELDLEELNEISDPGIGNVSVAFDGDPGELATEVQKMLGHQCLVFADE